MMYVWLDDERQAPYGWVWIKSVEDLIILVNNYKKDIEIISLDHDLGDGKKTGYDFLNWLEGRVFVDGWRDLPEITIHSQNPVGRANMERALNKIKNMI